MAGKIWKRVSFGKCKNLAKFILMVDKVFRNFVLDIILLLS